MKEKQESHRKPVDEAGLMQFLPAIITKITPQARNSSRASLFIEGRFFYGCFYESLKLSGLKSGEILTPEQFSQLTSIENCFKLREYFIGLLSRREHSASELKQKARQKRLNTDKMEEVLAELENKGYLNEQRFTELFIRDKKNLKKWGNHKIKNELKKKGIPDALIEKSLPAEDAEDTHSMMLSLILKNKKRFSRELNIFKRKKKILDHLLRKGFSSDIIFNHLDEFTKLTEAEGL